MNFLLDMILKALMSAWGEVLRNSTLKGKTWTEGAAIVLPIFIVLVIAIALFWPKEF